MDPTSQNHTSARGVRLDSWKEIAAYLKRDIRTAQRWEKHEDLPVHRHLHDERGTAYAYSGEIDEWLQNRSRRENAVAAADDAKPSRRPAVLIAIVAAAGVAAIASWAPSRLRTDPTPLSSLSVVFAPSERIREWGPDMALSPDGSLLVYVTESGQLHLRRLDQLTSRAIANTEGSWAPFFSPDGRWIGFNRVGRLMKVSIDGGAPVPLGATTDFMGVADWGADDNIVYATTTPEGTHGLYRVAAKGGTPQLVAALDGTADDAYWLTPQFVANGNIVLCTLARTVASGGRFQVVAVSVASGERRVLVDDARHAMYIGDGVLVYWRNDALFATRFDVDRVDVTGPHVPGWDDVWERVRMRSWTSAAGTLVYWPNVRVSHRLVWIDRAGRQDPLPLPPALYHAPRVSPDGRSIAYAIGHDLNSDVWKYDVKTRSTVRLTSDGRSAVPLWTLDGSRLIISSRRATGPGRDLAALHLSSAAEPEPIALSASFFPGANKLPVAWSDGGRTLLVRHDASQPRIWAVTLDGGREPRPAVPSAIYAHVSPDGRWIAYTAPDSTTGRNEIYVAPFPAGRPEWKVSTSGGVLPVWARSGRELFYRYRDGIMAVSVALGQSFTFGTPQLLFEAPSYEGDPGSPNYDVAADDQRFIVVLPATTGGPARLNVIQGWKAEILRRLEDAR